MNSESFQYIDAHCHLHFSSLREIDLEGYLSHVSRVVVNGTCPRDWAEVAELAERFPEQLMPSFGVHPWEVNDLRLGWEEELRAYLKRFPQAGVGEVGLDKWVKGYDLKAQLEAFQVQLEIAHVERRPLSVHCINAWGSLQKAVTGSSGFLLHAYAGPPEYVSDFLAQGAYFSFSPYFFHTRKDKQRETFKRIPLDRILLETDAPSMLGPKQTWSHLQKEFSLTEQHPLNIKRLYSEVARLLDMNESVLEKQVAENYQCWWQTS